MRLGDVVVSRLAIVVAAAVAPVSLGPVAMATKTTMAMATVTATATVTVTVTMKRPLVLAVVLAPRFDRPLVAPPPTLGLLAIVPP